MFKILPEYLSEWTTNKTKVEGVNCMPKREVEDYIYKNGQLSLVLTNGEIVCSC